MKAAPDRILRPEQARYLEGLLPPRPPALAAIEEEGRRSDVPIVDPEVGLFLDQVVRMTGSRRALEIGTAIGYSGNWIAGALPAGGRLVTVEADPARAAAARANFARAGNAGKVEIVVGRSLDVLGGIEGPFDLAFLDARKEDYREEAERVLPAVRLGGVLVLDNLLWGGAVAGEGDDEATAALRAFNRWFVGHPRLRAQILPLGDGTGFAVRVG